MIEQKNINFQWKEGMRFVIDRDKHIVEKR